MSGTVFGSRIRSSVSTFAVAALLAAAPALVVGSASAATTEPTAPSATVTTAPAPKVEQKAETATKAPAKSDVQGPAQTSVQAPAKPTHVQVSNAPKVEVTKTQADAVAKELGAKPTDTLAVQLGQYHEKIEAANALKDSAARTKAVTEARQQLTAIGGKPVTPEQATKIDGILGIKTAPATVQ
ncbi:hypothetical protein [Azospirillum doebereinerae]|uniref:Uncharacterized protein n=1 Tax=Azospirillum doebereinerae TaxID=92933 RepID=A0A433JEY4_9PROT|nr:hypothetical protein [Azospirillum doebereinerae]RUQ75726.1 hypothetical protein EJ913_01010 [Azospirillum doebereinerae]